MSFLVVKNLKKVYSSKFNDVVVNALNDVSFSVEEGEFVAIMGESGSGKTTLLNILSALDKPTKGTVLLDGKDMSQINEKQLSSFRRKNLGFVFQDFNLLDAFNLKDNILLPLVLSNESYEVMEKKLDVISNKINIKHILKKYPYEVSGGQKQRVAIARALISQPKLILADEPTGALDSNSSTQILQEFKAINEDGQTILMVTHSVKAAASANRVLFIKDGIVYNQIYKGNSNEQEFYDKISNSLTVLSSRG